MSKWLQKTGILAIICFMFMMTLGMTAMAQSDDNSLSSLGITTEGVTLDQDFSPSTWEVTATVPAGTTELSLDPVPSAAGASIKDISGTTLNADGTGTVLITVTSESGLDFTYTVHVVSDGGSVAPQTEVVTEAAVVTPQPQTETETETEDDKYVRVDRNTLTDAENTISRLQEDVAGARADIKIYTKIIYALIAFSVVMLFIVINLLLRRKDLKDEVAAYRSLGYSKSDVKGKAKGKANVKATAQAQSVNGQAHAPQGMPQTKHRPYVENPIDVKPQKSRKLPSYEDEQAAARAAAQAKAQAEREAQMRAQRAAQEAAAHAARQNEMQAQQEAASKTAQQIAAERAAARPQEQPKKNVEINMIDL